MNIEMPIFDVEAHAMAMDRRPLIAKIKSWVKEQKEKNSWSQPGKKSERPVLLSEEPVEEDVEL
jgi:hypothetical protein